MKIIVIYKYVVILGLIPSALSTHPPKSVCNKNSQTKAWTNLRICSVTLIHHMVPRFAKVNDLQNNHVDPMTFLKSTIREYFFSVKPTLPFC